MKEVKQTEEFEDWLSSLKDLRGRARIAARVVRLAHGNPGDVKPIGSGLSELRINTGPGYRVYFVERGNTLVILLCGGDKDSQQSDIARAHKLSTNLEN